MSPTALIVPLTFMPIVPLVVVPTSMRLPAPVWFMVPLCWKPTVLPRDTPVMVAACPADRLSVTLPADVIFTPLPVID